MWLVNGIFHFIRSTQTVSKVVTPFSTPISSFDWFGAMLEKKTDMKHL